jgi:hypothetical protein
MIVIILTVAMAQSIIIFYAIRMHIHTDRIFNLAFVAHLVIADDDLPSGWSNSNGTFFLRGGQTTKSVIFAGLFFGSSFSNVRRVSAEFLIREFETFGDHLKAFAERFASDKSNTVSERNRFALMKLYEAERASDS